MHFAFFILTLLTSFAGASSDFSGFTLGLGTSDAVTFDLTANVSPNPWLLFSKTGNVYLDNNNSVAKVTSGGTPSIITSQFSFLYGKVDWIAKVSAGLVVTSFKLSAAETGLGILVGGETNNKITTTYNGKYNDNDIFQVPEDLSNAYHKFTIEWSASSISWYVDDQCYRTLEISSFTDQADINNWPTTPTTVNFMIESIAAPSTYTHEADLSSITVQDSTGARFYDGSSGKVVGTNSGNSYTCKGVTYDFPDAFQQVINEKYPETVPTTTFAPTQIPSESVPNAQNTGISYSTLSSSIQTPTTSSATINQKNSAPLSLSTYSIPFLSTFFLVLFSCAF